MTHEHSTFPDRGAEILVASRQPDLLGMAYAEIFPEYVWLNGELFPSDQAQIPVLSPSFQFGASVFEGIGCYSTSRGPAAFRLEDHLKRFLGSASVLGITDLDYSVENLRDAACRVVYANGLTACYVRSFLYFHGPSSMNLDMYSPVVGVTAQRWETPLRQSGANHVLRLMVSSITGLHPNANMTKAGTGGQYVNSIMAKTMAVRAGFDDAVLLDPDGYVAECTGANLFMVRDGVVYAVPSASTLEGITRDSVMHLARDAGLPVREERVSRDQLYLADELFGCSTEAGVVAIVDVDYRPVGDGRPGPITKQLIKLYDDTLRGKTMRSSEWLDYLLLEPLV